MKASRKEMKEKGSDFELIDGGFHIPADGTFIHTRFHKIWGARKVCLLVHGSGRNANQYDHIARSFVRRGYSCLAYDQRFHGTSGGGHRNYDLEDMKVFEDDLEYILRNCFPQIKFDHIFIVAHSMGSMITWGLEVRTTGLQKINPRVRGVLSLGTCFDIGYVPSVFKLLHPLWVSNWSVFFPNCLKYKVFGQQTRGADLSIRSEKFLKMIIEKDLRKYENKTVQFCVLYYDYLQNYLRPNLHKIKTPCKFFHGTADSRCPIEGMFEGYGKISSVDKSMKLYYKYYHELLLEDEYEKVMDDMCEWIKERYPVVLKRKGSKKEKKKE